MSRAQPNPTESQSFWQDALAWHGAVTAKILPRLAFFGAYALVVALLHQRLAWTGIEPIHLGYTGGFLALLLMFRTITAYDRWWEARKIWGGIVNQSRNLAVGAIAYGPEDPGWRGPFVRWTAAFSETTRQTLEGRRDGHALGQILEGAEPDAAARLLAAGHMPSHVAGRLGHLLRQAREADELDGFLLLGLDRERATLIDHVGACERILRTALPRVHSIKLRRFILLYLLGLPLALAISQVWMSLAVTVLVGYFLLGIDQVAHELENPFDPERASHLPLQAICAMIDTDLRALVVEARAGSWPSTTATTR